MGDTYIHRAASYAFEALEFEKQRQFQAASQAFGKAAEILLHGGRSDSVARRQRAVRLRIAEYLTRAERLKTQATAIVPSSPLDEPTAAADPPVSLSKSADSVTRVLHELGVDPVPCPGNATTQHPPTSGADAALPMPRVASVNPSLQDTAAHPASTPSSTPSSSSLPTAEPGDSVEDVDTEAAKAVLNQAGAAIAASTADTLDKWCQSFGEQPPQADTWDSLMPSLKYTQDEDELVKQQYLELFGSLP